MKASLLLSRNTFLQTSFAAKSLIILVLFACFSNSLRAGGKPAAKHYEKDVPISSTIRNTHGQVVPAISYTTPHNYMGTVAIATLSPTSSGVAALSYNLAGINAGSGFNGPRGLATDAAGNVYVADFTNNQVKKIPAGGGSPTVVGFGFSNPIAVAVDAAGNVYVSDIGTNTVKKVPVGGGATVVVGMGFNGAYSIACDPAGNIYVADSGNKALKMIPAAGGNPIVITTGYKSLISVGVDGFGNVYTGDSIDNTIYKFPAGTNVPAIFATGFVNPIAISADGEGNVYIADATDNLVKRYPVAGGAPTILNLTAGLTTGIAVDGAGSIYAADYNNNLVKKIDPVGGYFINQVLPKGLKFNGANGNITGTPAKASPATDYTVTAYNSFGGGSTIVNIKVTPLTFSYSTPLIYTAGVGIAPLSPSGSGVGVPAYDNLPVTVSAAFAGPWGLTMDASRNIYVADYFGGVVKKVPVGGGAPVAIGSGFIHPTGVAVDAAGNVFVSDISSTNIMKILAGGGAPVTVATGFSSPLGIAIDTKGNLYVADSGSQTVKVIPVGGVPFDLKTGFTGLSTVAVDAAGNVYAGDTQTHKVYKIPYDGSAAVLVSTGFSTGLNSPKGIAVDAIGNIYVADSNNNVVYKFPVGGGAPILIGSGQGSMIGVIVDPSGVLYITDFSNKTLQKLTPVGGCYLSQALPAGLNFDEATGTISGTPTGGSPATNYTVTAYNTSGSAQAIVNIKVKVLDVSYSSPKTYITATPISPLAPTSAGVAAVGYTNSPITIGSGFSKPWGVAVDAAGNIYVADFQSNTVKKMPAGGGIPVLIGSGFNGPSGVALDAAGNVYVADYTSNSVKKIPVGGGATVIIGSGFLHPMGVAVDGAGNIFVSDNGNHAIKEIPAAGGAVINLGTYTNPLGIATDVAGNVYFSEKSNGVIYKIPAIGGAAIIIASGFNNPLGLTVDVSGNLFVADGAVTTLLELPVTGNSLLPISAGFNNPAGVAIDAAGNLYVADYLNSAVKKIKPVGGYYINALPTGLNFDNSTGILNGTPAVASPATDFTVTAYNSFGSNSATINIKVDLLPLPVISYPVVPAFVVNTAITPIAPQSSGVAMPGYTTAPVNLGSGYNNPVGITVASTGEVYIADAGNHAVKLIYPNNNNVYTIGSGLNSPNGVATDASGNVYVTDQLTNAVKRIAMPANTTTTVATGFNTPCGVAVDAAGNIYVADKGNNVVKEIPFGGGATIVIGSGFNQPSGVAVDISGNVYVADFGNDAIKMIPVGGGSPVTLGSGFSQPTSIALDASGNIYIADTGNNAIEKMPAGGGVPVVICTAIIHPRSVAVGYDGVVYATDNVGNNVKIIKPVGGYYVGSALPAGLSIDNTTGVISGTPLAAYPYKYYYVTGYNNTGGTKTNASMAINLLPPPFVGYSSPHLYVQNVTISPLTPVSSSVSAAGYSSVTTNIGTGLSLPVGVAADAAGNVYVADSGTGLVKKIQKVGGGTISIGTGFNTPSGVAVDGASNVYVSDSGNNIVYKIPANGSPTITLGAGFSSPSGVAVDSLGNVYVADKGNHAIKKIPAGGGAIVTFASGLTNPAGVASDANGNIYVADASDNVIKKIAAAGGSPIVIASGFSQPVGIAVDASGNLYVTNVNNSVVDMVPSGGGPMTVVGSGFNHPYGVAIDAAGTVYVADYLNNIVKKTAPIGGFYIKPALPNGLIFNSNTGVISGMPTMVSAQTDYQVIGYNIYGISTATVNLTVNLAPLPTLSYTTPQVYLTGIATAPLTPVSTGVAAAAFSNTPFKIKSGGSFYGIAVDAAGNLYIADRSSTSIIKIPANGGPVTTLASGFNLIAGVAVDVAGNVYVGFYNTPSIKMIPVGGGALVDVGSGFAYPSGIALDAAGNIFVTDQNTGNVYKIPAGGGAQVQLASAIGNPTGIAVDAYGNLYLACPTINTVKKIPADGSPVVIIGSGFNQPYGVAVDNLGNVFVADNSNSIKMIPTGGGAAVSVSQGYVGTTGITLDVKGNLFVADFGGGKVMWANRIGGYYINPALPFGLVIDNNTGVLSGTPLVIAPAKNYIATAYNGSGGTPKTINIAVNAGPGNSALSNLVVSTGSLAPAFTSAQINYTMTVPNATLSITITPTSANPTALIKVNGTVVNTGSASASIPLVTGNNAIVIGVTSKDGTTTTTYTLQVTRAGSANALLTSIKTSPSTTLTTVGGPDFRDYTTAVPNSVASLQVTATTQDATASITVNGVTVASGTASQLIPLNVGSNVISTVVTAQDGITTKAYVITANRAVPPVTTLTALALSSGSLSPAFTAATINYTASVAYAVTITTITPTATDASTVIKVNGTVVNSGTASASIPLAIGLNTETIAVTSQDGTVTTTYMLKITRISSTNALLTSIKTSPSTTLTTVVGADFRDYTTSVSGSVASLQVIATTQDSTATITVNGVTVASGTASQSIPLNVGSNVISTIVTAQDGVTTKAYVITVNRAALPITTLSALALSSGSLSPAFTAANLNYTSSVAYAVTTTTITPTATDASTIIKVNGTVVNSGTASASIPLAIGLNTETIAVTSQDGTVTTTYTLQITRVSSTNALLTSIKTTPSATLTTVIGADFRDYTTAIPNSQTSLTITATTQDPSATITVNGVAVASGAASQVIPLSIGSNVISTVVTAQDGVTTKSYVITATRATGPLSMVQAYENPDSIKATTTGIVVHQALSPNGDGIGDVLTIDGILTYPDNNFQVMNRGGVLVYRIKGYDNVSRVFDGQSNINGKLLQAGTYFYQLEYSDKGKLIRKTGYILLKY